MPNLNYADFLEEAIQSIVIQRYPNLQFIMVDGGSTDGSLEIIEKYRPHFSETIIGPDAGQADAINKGLALADGQLFQWINSDDILEPGALFAVARAIEGHDAVAGVCTNFDDQGNEEAVVSRRLSSRLMIRRFASVVWHQPALWMRTEAVRSCGGFDQTLHYMFDYALTVRYLHRYPRVHYLPKTLVRFRLHSSSKTTTAAPEFQRERREIISRIASDGDPGLRNIASRMASRMDWWDRLQEIQRGPDSRSGKMLRIIREALEDPFIRIGRGSLRALIKVVVRS